MPFSIAFLSSSYSTVFWLSLYKNWSLIQTHFIDFLNIRYSKLLNNSNNWTIVLFKKRSCDCNLDYTQYTYILIFFIISLNIFCTRSVLSLESRMKLFFPLLPPPGPTPFPPPPALLPLFLSVVYDISL